VQDIDIQENNVMWSCSGKQNC